VVTKEAPAPPASSAPRSTPQARDLTPTTTTHDRHTDIVTEWPSMAGNVFDLFVH